MTNRAELRKEADRCMRGGDHNEALMALRSFNTLASPTAVLSLLDECEEYESGMRAIACNLGAGGYNAAELSAAELLSKVNWGIDAFATSQQNLADSLRAERDAALAELAAIKASGWRNHSVNYAKGESCPKTLETAQAAWDRDQELIEEQRQQIAKDNQTINDLRQKLEACRKDVERYRWLRDGDSSKFLSLYACGMPFDQLDEAIDAAMSQEANHD